MTERDEEAAFRGFLDIAYAGKTVKLRPLSINATEEWLDTIGRRLADIEVPDAAGAEVMSSLLRAGTAAAVDALAAYDVDGVLGGPEAIRGDMTPAEVKAALDVVMSAAIPFDEDAARSVVAAYGAPARTLAMGMALSFVRASQQEPSTPGVSDAGASGTTRSGRRGRRSSSSSGGPTAIGSSRMNGSSDATPPPTA